MGDVPPDILAAIKAAAKEEWPDNRDMQEYCIEEEPEVIWLSSVWTLVALCRCQAFRLT